MDMAVRLLDVNALNCTIERHIRLTRDQNHWRQRVRLSMAYWLIAWKR